MIYFDNHKILARHLEKSKTTIPKETKLLSIRMNIVLKFYLYDETIPKNKNMTRSKILLKFGNMRVIICMDNNYIVRSSRNQSSHRIPKIDCSRFYHSIVYSSYRHPNYT